MTAQVQLDTLSDHDLLVRIAAQCECLPDVIRRLGEAEKEIVRLKTENRIVVAIGTALATVIGVFAKP